MYIYIIDIIPLNAIAALLCQKAIFSMLRRNSRSDIVIIFWATSFSLVCVDHVGAQRQRCALKLVQCLATWVRVFLNCFPEKKTNGHIRKSCRRNFNALRRNFPTLRRNFLEPWQNSFPTIFAAHRLAESMEKRSFALSRARVLGPPLCQSSVCMVNHSSTALTTIDLWQPHFWMSCVKISGLRQKRNAVWESGTFFFGTQHLSR